MPFSEAQDKIDIAKARLIIDHPFLASIAMRLKWIEDEKAINPLNGQPKMMVNIKELRYHPDLVASMKQSVVLGSVCHEIMHLVYQHVLDWRSGEGKVSIIWTMAQEQVVNDAVLNMFNGGKFRSALPEGVIYDEGARGMYTEEAYDYFLNKYPEAKDNQESLANMLGGDSEDGEDSPLMKLAKEVVEKMVDHHEAGEGTLTEQERTQQEREIKALVAEAAACAKDAGKMPAGLERYIDEFLEAKIPWQQHLAEFTCSMARDDFSFRRPARKYLYSGIISPSIRSELLEVAIAFDLSGSVGREEQIAMYTEFRGILAAFPSYVIHLMSFDYVIQNFQTITTGQEADLEALFKGGGGTAFEPIFSKLAEEGITPNCLIILTDGYASYSFPEPEYPVLWTLTENHSEPPWGKIALM
jgi:predicted metal-dependent peptidase